ncbi:MAG: cyclic nucleotide-binding domain-containing protein [Luteimonas sp.]
MDLHMLVEHVGPFHAGEHLFREGDPFKAIAAVRAGMVKTYVIDRDGREHVLDFHLPGEVIGLNAIDGEHYPCNAVTLDTAMLCRFPFPKMAVFAARLPGLQQQLFRLLSRDIGRAALLSGDWSADQRMAAFLIALSHRFAARVCDDKASDGKASSRASGRPRYTRPILTRPDPERTCPLPSTHPPRAIHATNCSDTPRASTCASSPRCGSASRSTA